jgi:hypothetical protein
VQRLEVGIGDCRIDYGDAAGVAAGLLDGVQRHEIFNERRREGVFPAGQRIRARSTRLAGSVRDRVIATNLATSSSPINNSIACRHAVMTFNPVLRIGGIEVLVDFVHRVTLPADSLERTGA